MKSRQDDHVYDITIIGGGPTGLFAAFYAGMRDASTKIIDSLPSLGGQLTELYPEKFIYDVAGFPRVRATDLVRRLVEQASQYHPTVCLNERVEQLTRRVDGTFEMRSDIGHVHLSRSVVITGGIGAFTPKPLPAENVSRYTGNGVYYHINNVQQFQGQRVLVVGGGDSAVDFALMLEMVADEVTLIHRRDQFRAHEENVRALANSTVHVMTHYELVRVDGDPSLQHATIIDNRSKETMELQVDAIVGSLGFSASLGPILNWGLEVEGDGIVVNTQMATNIPGVFAAGDIVTYPGKMRLIALGFGEAPIAVNHAKIYLDPQSKLFPGHSSSRKE